MLQKDIHLAIVQSIIWCCTNVSSQRKRVWPDENGRIYDFDSWVTAGRPHPIKTLSASEVPEVQPLALLRCLKDFFQNDIVRQKLQKSVTRGVRPNIETLMDDSWVHRIDSTMEFFNGRRYIEDTLSGGLTIGRGYSSGPASNRYPYLSITPEEIDAYYRRWGCEGDFVHKRNLGIGWRGDGAAAYWSTIDGSWTNYNSHNFCSVYRGVDETIRSDVHPYLLEENTITNLSKVEKVTYINMFLKKLCEMYEGEEGNSPVDRATWYEVSEFIIFYHDIWDTISTSEGDDECWVSENITSGPLTHRNHEGSTMYEIPGVWHISEGGKWTSNFETIMKIGLNDWNNSIWKKKYETYLQRIFEDEGTLIYNQIIEVELETEDEDLLQVRTYNTGGSSDEEVEREEEGDEEEITAKEKMNKIMEYLFNNSEKLQEGVYLDLSNKLKDVYESL